MKAQGFDAKGKKTEQVKLDDAVFGVKPNTTLLSQAVRVHLINARQGTRSTKGRSDLHYSGKKIYAQKHTGRARHGDRTAPIFMHGAVSHGPKPYVPHASMPRAMKEVALKSALSILAREGNVFVIAKLDFDGKGATKKAVAVFDKLGFNKVLIVPEGKEKLGLGLRNLKGVRVVKSELLSAYDVSISPNLLFTANGLDALAARLSGKGETK